MHPRVTATGSMQNCSASITKMKTFPQEERLIQNEYSINLPAKYYLKNKIWKNWVNIINPFRSLLVLGSPGSGRSYFVIRHVISQHLEKGFSQFEFHPVRFAKL